MHNIPKFYTTKKLLHRQVLKFDIREPGPYHQLWHGKKLDPEHAPQECIIEAKGEIQKTGTDAHTKKRTLGKKDDPQEKYTKHR